MIHLEDPFTKNLKEKPQRGPPGFPDGRIATGEPESPQVSRAFE